MKIIVVPQTGTTRNESTSPADAANAAVPTDRVAGQAYVVHVDTVTIPGELSNSEWSALMGLS
jgi:hypothetical protein